MTKLERILNSKSKEEILKIFESAKSMIDLCKNKLGVHDNTQNVTLIKIHMESAGLDPQTYFKRKGKNTHCMQCGAELISKYQKKFCCYSCSNTYTNLHRETLKYRTKLSKCIGCGCDVEVQINTSSKFVLCEKCKSIKNEKDNKSKEKNRLPKTRKIPVERQCIYCGKTFYTKTLAAKFCSPHCATSHTSDIKHEERKKYYYEHQDEFVGVQDYKVKKLKQDFIKEQDNKCAICGIDQEWNDKRLVFILDHIDGDATNNVRSNLRCICPNCDSQLDTYKSKNKHSTRRSYYRNKTIRLAQEKLTT